MMHQNYQNTNAVPSNFFLATETEPFKNNNVSLAYDTTSHTVVGIWGQKPLGKIYIGGLHQLSNRPLLLILQSTPQTQINNCI